MVARSQKGQAQTPFNGDGKEYIVLKRGHYPWLLREIGLLGSAVNRELKFRQVL